MRWQKCFPMYTEMQNCMQFSCGLDCQHWTLWMCFSFKCAVTRHLGCVNISQVQIRSCTNQIERVHRHSWHATWCLFKASRIESHNSSFTHIDTLRVCDKAVDGAGDLRRHPQTGSLCKPNWGNFSTWGAPLLRLPTKLRGCRLHGAAVYVVYSLRGTMVQTMHVLECVCVCVSC